MKLDIIDIRKFKTFTNYKVVKSKEVLWLSTKEFKENKCLFKITLYEEEKIELSNGCLNTIDGIVELKEPFDNFYKVEDRENKNGKFKVLLPKGEKTTTSDSTTPNKNKKSTKKNNSSKQTSTDNKHTKQNKSTNTKYDFIRELLENKKINQSQRERILKLASKEISLEGNLEERVKKIEEIIINNIPKSNDLKTYKPVKTVGSSLPKYIDPYHLYKFLFEYNQNPVLRSTCHDIDSEELKKINDYCDSDTYDFEKHLNKIVESFNEHEKKFFAPGKAKALIRGYLTGKDYKGNPLKKGWSFTDEIKINWSSDKLYEWVTKNPNIPPNFNENIAANQEIELFNIEPQIDSPITNEPIQSFTQLVLHFKNLFHIKSGNQSLRAILDRVNSMGKWNEKVEIDIPDKGFPNNLEHFTDVDKLVTAYDILLRLIIQQHQRDEKPKVKLQFYEENQRVNLSIHHLNGQYNKTVQNCIDRPYGRDYKNLISSQINGLCNFYLKADFGSKEFAAINLWDGKKLEAHKLNSFIGVEHILEFPKIKES